MKSNSLLLSCSLLVVLLIAFTSATTIEPNPADATADANPFKIDFVSTVINADLETRFETQFGNIHADVTRIDVHYNEVNEYYYAVYGTDADGNQVFDHYKTTAEEVATETYNYIEMTERTTNAFQKCREVTVFPFQGNFCDTYNSGPVCGVVIWPFGCFLY